MKQQLSNALHPCHTPPEVDKLGGRRQYPHKLRESADVRGRKHKPTVLKVIEGNPGRRLLNGREPQPPSSLPTCPSHLWPTASTEWKRLARVLNEIGLLTQIDRTVFAAYCHSYGRWVEAERKLADTPPLLKTPAGYVQVSPWMTIANKQLELMAKFIAEIGLTPPSRCRIAVDVPAGPKPWETGLEAKYFS